MFQIILENKYNYDNRSFAFCQSCYWTATILTNIESNECPVCGGDNIDLMPLNLNKKYEFQLDPNKGLEIKFAKRF